MPPSRSPRRDDEDVLDPVEAADVDGDDEAADQSLDTVDDAPDLGDEDQDDDVEPDADFVADDDVDREADVVPTLAVFDDDDEEISRVVADDDDDDDGDIDGLREGEFVCRSCFMAKRESALADPKRLLCRDCA